MHKAVRLCLALWAASVAAPSTVNADMLKGPGGADLGEFVRQDCGSCHGLTLKGGLGRPITSAALAEWDAETIAEIVLRGMPGTAMPGWDGVIGEAEARAIAEGLKKGRFE